MSLLSKIKADQVEARKSNDKVAAGLLTTLIGEASKISKDDFENGITETNDEKVVVTLKKFLKGAEETARLLEDEFQRVIGHPSTDGQTHLIEDGHRDFFEEIVPKMRKTDREIQLLNSYIPKQLDETELRSVIVKFMDVHPDANIGTIMSYLKMSHTGLYDGKIASQLAKEAITK